MSFIDDLKALDLDIDEENATKINELLKEQLKDYVPRSRLNDEIKKKTDYESEISMLKEKINKESENNLKFDDLKAHIAALESEKENKETEYKTMLDKMKLDNEVSLAISNAGARHYNLVETLIDKSKLKFQDGNIIGLDEQIQELKNNEETKYLFKNIPGSLKGSAPDNSTSTLPHKEPGSMREALELDFKNRKNKE